MDEPIPGEEMDSAVAALAPGAEAAVDGQALGEEMDGAVGERR